MLSELHLRNVGPTTEMDVEFAERLTIFTGDNGLGKTFLLDCAWWALTGSWPGPFALPRAGATSASIAPRIAREDGATGSRDLPQFTYNYRTQSWGNRVGFFHHKDPIHPAIYARADGGVSVFEPLLVPVIGCPTISPQRMNSYSLNFSVDQIWDEYKDRETGALICNGLIRDLVQWQYSPDQDENSAFATFNRVLRSLSHPDEAVEISKPSQVYLLDRRHYPSIKTSHGEYPIHLAPAGLKRILGLAYMMVWAWKEHQGLARLTNTQPARHLDILIDEIELHLHPKWQRSILPALMLAGEGLASDMTTQLFVTTHSPLVLASIEPEFDEEHDRLFVFDVKDNHVVLNELPWAKQGDASNWLLSDAFDQTSPRSIEAERAIQAAQDFMLGLKDKLPPGLKTKKSIHKELLRVLPDHDRFWPRWIVTAYETAGKGS